jgi:putative flippase GtrA
VIRKFARFVVVGVIGFGVDAGLTVGLSKSGFSPIVARIPALICAIFSTWYLNRIFTFEVEARPSRAELARYFFVAIISAMLNFTLYSVFVYNMIAPFYAVAIATLSLTILSFFAYRTFAFRAGR